MRDDRESWPDARLVEAARGGDRLAFEFLVRRHQGAVRAVARALGGEPSDAAQDAFLRAWTNLDLLVDPARFGAWCSRLAFACAIDGLRRRPDHGELPAELAAPLRDPEVALADHELALA